MVGSRGRSWWVECMVVVVVVVVRAFMIAGQEVLFLIMGRRCMAPYYVPRWCR